MSDLDAAFNRAADEVAREVSRRERQEEEILAEMRAAAEALAVRAAQQKWTLILVTGDGATRRMGWTGDPPSIIHTALCRSLEGDVLFSGDVVRVEPQPIRRYEMERCDWQRRVVNYREIVR